MSFQKNKTEPSVKLLPVLAIGFSGHRTLPNESNCREAIRGALEDWKARVPGAVYGVSSAAAGGDLLFAETCIELGLPVRILLPFPAEQFREDFDDTTWRRAERVLAQAVSVEITGDGQSRPEMYYECGVEMVRQSRLLIALWNGQTGQGLGGTEDIIQFAKARGRSILWINSATGAVQYLNEDQELLHDQEVEFLNELPDYDVKLSASTPEALAQAWLLKVRENASKVAPQFRRLAAIPTLCTAAAALFVGAGAFAGASVICLGLGTILGMIAATLPMVMKLRYRQVIWARVRTASEVCRSFLALWQTPTPYDVIGPEVVPELGGMLVSLNFLKMLGRAKQEVPLAEFKKNYREDRIGNQIAYFSGHAIRAEAQMRKYQRLTWVCITLATVLNLGTLSILLWPEGWILRSWKPGLALAATTCLQIATVVGALSVVNDYQRRRQRYQELHHMLTEWDEQLELARTWSGVLRITSKVEKALLTELIEWRTLIRYGKQK
jgi:hypothetical protein